MPDAFTSTAYSASVAGHRCVGRSARSKRLTPAGAQDGFESEVSQLGDNIDREAPGDRFGSELAMSADGFRVIVGAPSNDGTGRFSGHARVYEWDGVADFSAAKMQGANLRGASLARSRMRGVRAEGAYFTSANLEEVDLVAADLSGARLTGANLERAKMLDCSCDDRALSAAKGTAVLVSQRDDKESRRGGGSATAFPDWGYSRSRNTSMWSWRESNPRPLKGCNPRYDHSRFTA